MLGTTTTRLDGSVVVLESGVEDKGVEMEDVSAIGPIGIVVGMNGPPTPGVNGFWVAP